MYFCGGSSYGRWITYSLYPNLVFESLLFCLCIWVGYQRSKENFSSPGLRWSRARLVDILVGGNVLYFFWWATYPYKHAMLTLLASLWCGSLEPWQSLVSGYVSVICRVEWLSLSLGIPSFNGVKLIMPSVQQHRLWLAVAFYCTFGKHTHLFRISRVRPQVQRLCRTSQLHRARIVDGGLINIMRPCMYPFAIDYQGPLKHLKVLLVVTGWCICMWGCTCYMDSKANHRPSTAVQIMRMHKYIQRSMRSASAWVVQAERTTYWHCD